MCPLRLLFMDISPHRAGIGLRFDHYDALLETRPTLGFLEIHTENFFGGGYHREVLDELAKDYAISCHCVGLSLGSSESVDMQHVHQVKQVVERYQPAIVSDHASWSRSGNAHFPDLLPLPYIDETLRALADNVMRVQDALGRQLLIENPSTYLQFSESSMSEPEFLSKLCRLAGCGLLLDVNNIAVQAHNHGFNALHYFDSLEGCFIGEIHLAGHIEQEANDGGEMLRIDTHSQPVSQQVWQLYNAALERLDLASIPSLIEWDKDMPELSALLDEARKADAYIHTALERRQLDALG